jgi:hypothetical protein
MPQLEVYCTVSNCHYWADGNHCVAEKILITTDDIGRKYPEAADVGSAQDIVRQHGTTEAKSCMETCCKTFTPKGEGRPSGTPDKMESKAKELAGKY